ncbi:MAG: HD domain-containing protein [Patescibacteria group bacterium]|jgi:HD superfamily phosphohydrolase
MTPDRPLFLQKDQLYGEVVLSEAEQRIVNTPQIQRLNDISLSAVPPITLGKVIPSRLDHSIGVAYLAKIVGQKPEFNQFSKELIAAGIAHDVGSPPFSHLGERFLEKVFGVSHEKFAETIITNSELSREFTAQGIDTNTVLKLINGQLRPISDIVAGSMDIDNLDNIQRYGNAMGIIDTSLYSGERLTRAYTLHNGEVALAEGSEEDLKGWLESRHRVYQFVYGAGNQVMGAMTRRALQFAYEDGELKEEFFFWTDTQAYNYLLQNCNLRTKKLAELAANKHPYKTVTDLVITNPSDNFVKLCADSDNREVVADSLAEEFSIPREDVCIYFGKSRNYRSINLPIINRANTANLNGIKQEWTAQVFVHKDHIGRFEKLDEAFRELVGVGN